MDNTNKPESEFLTPKEVAARLKLKPRTVERLCKSRRLKATKIANQWRIKTDDIEQMILSHDNMVAEEVTSQESKKG